MIEKLGITPGPWNLVIEKHVEDVYGEVKIWFRPVVYSKEKNIICGHLYYETITEANARAIAAVPDMLEALIDLYDDWENVDYHAEHIKSVIEKATRSWEEIKEALK